MGNNHSNKLSKSPQANEKIIVESEDLSDSFDLKALPNNDLYMSGCEEGSSEGMSNRNSSDQALKICMENPNSVSELVKNIDKQALILKSEYRDAILCNITNIANETSEIHQDSDYLYL